MFNIIKKEIHYCDHSHQTYGQVRLLPYSDDGNIIVCHKHYLQEIAYRKSEGFLNLPNWEDLKIYEVN